MATLDADTLTDVTDLTDDTVALKIVNAACSRITAHGYTIQRIPEGSTSRTVNDKELGWVQTVAVAIYAKDYLNSGMSSKGDGVSVLSSSANSGSDPDVLAEQAAAKLLTLEDTDFNQAFI
jgi:hypothetical protein